jgi:ubiquinone/menaquinone biosynthesis C-methylase UbiE
LEATASEWSELCRTLTINDIEAFAGRMKDLGLEYNCQFLVDWAADLTEQAADFNLVTITAGLELFPDIVAQVKGLAAKERS